MPGFCEHGNEFSGSNRSWKCECELEPFTVNTFRVNNTDGVNTAVL